MAELDPKPELAGGPEHKRGRRQQFQPWLAGVSSVVLFSLVWLLLSAGLPKLDPGALTHPARIFIILIAGLLPAIIYSYFIHGRLPVLHAEYKQNLRRLGFPENANLYQEKFDAVYGPEAQLDERTILPADQRRPAAGRRDRALRLDMAPAKADQRAASIHAQDEEIQFDEALTKGNQRVTAFQSPILIATLLSLLGWLLVFYPSKVVTGILIPNPEPLIYGFLGAYIFVLGSLLRQYVIDDLQPRYYASITARYLTVFTLSWLIALMVNRQSSDTSNLNRYLLAAFVIGLFPTIGLRVAQRQAAALLGTKIERFREEFPLSKLDGLNVYQEDRLLLEGIENLQHLSCANIVDLMLKTRYPVEQLVDWIDQALLHLHTRTNTEHFQKSGIRTATDLLDACDAPRLTPEQKKKRRNDLASLIESLSFNDKQVQNKNILTFIEMILSALGNDPNMFHIRYWRAHEFDILPEEVEDQRILADLKLMQRLPDEAIIAYDELLRIFPTYYNAYLYRGLAYFTMKEYNRAIDSYDEAIDAINLRNLHRYTARYAFVERGRALRELKAYDDAVKNYRDALLVYNDFPEARFELAYILMTKLSQYDEAIEHLEVLTKGNLKLQRFMQILEEHDICDG